MFKLSKKNKECLLKIGIGILVIVILFRLFKNTYRNNPVIIEGQFAHLDHTRAIKFAIENHKKRIVSAVKAGYREGTGAKWEQILGETEGAGKECPYVDEDGAHISAGDAGPGEPSYERSYFFPKDNASKFTKEECAEKCAEKKMPYMSHGRSSDNTNIPCKPDDLGCKGKCYCYKTCRSPVRHSAYNVYKRPRAGWPGLSSHSEQRKPGVNHALPDRAGRTPPHDEDEASLPASSRYGDQLAARTPAQWKAVSETKARLMWRDSLITAKGAGKACVPGLDQLRQKEDEETICWRGRTTRGHNHPTKCRSMTKKECSEQCDALGFPYMSHGPKDGHPHQQGARNQCKPEDLDCKGKCNCYKTCRSQCTERKKCTGLKTSGCAVKPRWPGDKLAWNLCIKGGIIGEGTPNPAWNTYLKPSEGWPKY